MSTTRLASAWMRFTDQNGNQRWFTQTAMADVRPVAKGDTIPLHYAAAKP